jgi:threonylcarbamoyladenosine tRNA methylthiotransferase MtaB
MNVSISSLGCRLNQSELQSVITTLKDNGHIITKPDKSDVCIVNTCVVTHASERKTRKLIYQAERTKCKYIIVTGCFAKKIERDNSTIYISNDYKYLIPQIIDNNFIIEDEPLPSRFAYSPATGSLRTRINLKIQDGCDSYCSYCIIPFVRGKPVSKPAEDILSEFTTLLNEGYKEFLLTGVQIGMYKSGSVLLHGLIEKMLSTNGEYRIHLSSISPKYVTEQLINLFTSDKLVKHLHLSLQSGSDSVLKRMNRGYTSYEYIKIVEELKRIDPLFNFTTDLIVGFPDETESEFMDSVSVVKQVHFSHIHTFRYSQRKGTKAMSLGDTVSEVLKKERSNKIIDLYTRQKLDYYRCFNNAAGRMLTEKARDGETSGFTDYYVPAMLTEESMRNRFVNVITKLDEKRMVLIASPLS